MSTAASKRAGPVAPGVAFITGGARGLGNAIAVSFAKEGARGVVIVDINEDTLNEGKKIVERYGTPCLTVRADVTKEDDVERAIAEAVKAFGRIDYAANFAGILGPLTATWDTTLEDFNKGMVVNSTGVFLSTKHELLQMMKQESIEFEEGRVPQRGAIVNCASLNSQMSITGSIAYTTSKHAVMGITKTVFPPLTSFAYPFPFTACPSIHVNVYPQAALEAREHHIRVNAVSPGFLLTSLLEPVVGKEGGLPMEAWDLIVARQGRTAKFEEIGDVVVLMSTPRMSFVNGANLFVDGGFSINEM